jgi:hypothetical protein
MVNQPGDAGEHLHGPDIQIGALALPRRDKVVHLVVPARAVDHNSDSHVKTLEVETVHAFDGDFGSAAT